MPINAVSFKIDQTSLAQDLKIAREKLDSADEETCNSAVVAIKALGSEAKEAVPPLQKKLQDKNTITRRHAADALGLIGADAQAAVPDLIEMFADIQELHTVASRATSNIGKPAVALLTKALGDPRREEPWPIR